MIERMEKGASVDLIDALYVCKYKFENKPKKYIEIAEKVQLFLTHDINLMNLDQLTSLMELYNHNPAFLRFLVWRLVS